MRRKIGTGWLLLGTLMLSVSLVACGEESVDKCKDLAAACPTADAQMCSGNIIQKCQANADQCLVWTDTSTCGTRQKCTAQGVQASCQCNNQSGCDSVGKTKCSTNKITTCRADNNSCRYWEEGTDCAASNQFCDASSGAAVCSDNCQSDCTTEGAKRCSQTGEVIQTCTKVGDCLNWEDGTDCATQNPSKVCDDSGGTVQCTTLCVHECSTAGQSRCKASTEIIQTCTADNNGCRKWVDGDNCATNSKFCDASSQPAQCVDHCVDACTLTQTQCNGTVIETCATNATTGCTEWQAGTNCSTTADPFCDDSAEPAVCISHCVNSCPALNASQCNGNVIETCASHGGCLVWEAVTDCALTSQFCDDSGANPVCANACTDECVFGETQCVGNVIEECVNVGTDCDHWMSTTNCNDTNQFCDDSAEPAVCVDNCVDECVEGETQCNSTIIETCVNYATGCDHWVGGVNCAANSQICDDSNEPAICVVECIDPCPTLDEKRCNHETVEQCTLVNNCQQWQLTEDCTLNDQFCVVDPSLGPICSDESCVDLCQMPDSQCSLATPTLIEDCALNQTSGCTEWVAGVNCADSGQLCEDPQGTGGLASCVSVCINDCTEGASRCAANSEVIEICQLNASEGCWHYVAGDTDCAVQNAYCDDTSGTAVCVENCVSDCDTANLTACGGTMLWTCTVNGNCLNWVQTQDCLGSGQWCMGGQCQAMECTDLGSALNAAPDQPVASGDTTNAINHYDPLCSWGGARDVCYTWTAPSTGTFQIDLNGSNYLTALAILRMSQGEIGCSVGSVNGEDTLVALDFNSGDQFVIVVDGVYEGYEGLYSLNINTSQGEILCTDWSDNDGDNRVDCQDPTGCQPTAECEPGSVPTGGACTANLDCFANNRDPACLLASMGWPAGYCSEWCDLAANDCAAGSTCMNLGGNYNLCMATCDPADPNSCRADVDPQYGYSYSCCFGSRLCQPSWWSCDLCGNGVLDPDNGEQCDGNELDGQTCESLGFVGGGELTCTNCQFDTTGCLGEQVEVACTDWIDNESDDLIDCADPTACQGSAECVPGNNAVGGPCTANVDCAAPNGAPACMAQDFNWIMPAGYCATWCVLGGNDCPDGSSCIDFGMGTMGLCMDACSINDPCRNDTWDLPEYGITISYVCCPSSGVCQPDLYSCNWCGDGIVQPEFGEVCDGANLNQETCESLGFPGGGELSCNTCQFDTSLCSMGPCNAVDLGFFQGDIYLDQDSCTGSVAYNGTGCTGWDSLGNELVYQLTLPAGMNVQIQMNSDDLDASLYVVSFCQDYNPGQCLAASDNNYLGEGESVMLSNSGNADVTYYIVADAYYEDGYSPMCGTFSLQISQVANENVCTDWIDNDGDILFDCADPTNCMGTEACLPGQQAVGTDCTAHTQCDSLNGMPSCMDVASWGMPAGYCSSWCMGDDCPAGSICYDFDFGAGMGNCLATCDLADPNCLAGQTCFDVGGDQGVCFYN